MVHLIDARSLKDDNLALDRASQWLKGETRLAVLFLALKPIPRQGRERLHKQRIKNVIWRLRGQCSPSFLGLNLITLLRSDTDEGEVLLTDVTEGLKEIFKAHQIRYMEYFQRTAESKGKNLWARCASSSRRILRSR